MIKIGIIGGTGYTGVELLRLLVQHPEAQLTSITSRGEAGTPVAELFANLRGHVDLEFSAPEDADLTACDLVFSATPTGVAMTYARRLMDAGVRLIDVAADFRLRDRRTWEQWYQMEHTAPELLSTAVYGLPELFREQIRGAQLVANPGCYPTAAALALLPLVESPGLVDTQCLICDAKSGVSGAGRGAKVGSLLAEAADSLKAYAVPGHRHLPEIEQTLAHAAASPCWLTFVPHLTPMIRGIHATAYARLSRPDDVQQRFRARYAAEPFIDVLPPGSHPETRSVRGANMCRIAVHRPRDGDTVVVLSVIDNLVKGAAGQAVQNMNIMFGFAEALGLDAPAVMP